MFEERRKLFGVALRRSMRVREMDKTGAVKSYLNGLWISHLSGDAKCNVASAPNITLELTIIDTLLTIIVLKIKPCYFLIFL